MDKPLHVRVAEALGCKPRWFESNPAFGRPEGWGCGCEKQCPCLWVPPCGTFAGGAIERYDTDWAATGPLIEKYGISLWCQELRLKGDPPWTAEAKKLEAEAHEPLIAVCELLLKLEGR